MSQNEQLLQFFVFVITIADKRKLKLGIWLIMLIVPLITNQAHREICTKSLVVCYAVNDL